MGRPPTRRCASRERRRPCGAVQTIMVPRELLRNIARSLSTSMNDANQLELDPSGAVEIAASLASRSTVGGPDFDGTARLSALRRSS
jgi:hypothetical protein